MEHTFFVRVVHGAGDLHQERGALPRMLEQGTPGLEQAARYGVLHGVVRKTVRGFTHLENGHDIGMLEARGGLGLAPEPRHHVIRVALVCEDALERDDATGMRLSRLIDHTHAAARDLVENFVIGDVPVAVPRFYAGQHLLEGVFARRRFVFSQRAAQETIQTKAVRQAGNRLALVADFRFSENRKRGIGRGMCLHDVQAGSALNVAQR